MSSYCDHSWAVLAGPAARHWSVTVPPPRISAVFASQPEARATALGRLGDRLRNCSRSSSARPGSGEPEPQVASQSGVRAWSPCRFRPGGLRHRPGARHPAVIQVDWPPRPGQLSAPHPCRRPRCAKIVFLTGGRRATALPPGPPTHGSANVQLAADDNFSTCSTGV